VTNSSSNPTERNTEFISISKKVLNDICAFISFLEEEHQVRTTPKIPQTTKKTEIQTREVSDVFISSKALLKLATHAIKYANYKRNVWVEVIGLLAGNEKNGKMFINDAYPMGSGNAISVKIKNPSNYLKVWNKIRKKGDYIVGWYHSHPGYDLFMSMEDVNTQRRYQAFYEKSIALVFDPTLVNGKSWGFKIFRLKSINKTVWHEVSCTVEDGWTPKIFPNLLRFIDSNSLNDFVEHDR